ncbi:MAG: cell division protein [Gammaproteobacteria bacterium]|nr:MAG: cell division protein [Gammaproteobacteria bacterium]
MRRTVLLAGFAALGALLIGRAVQVQLVNADFYRNEGALRQVRNVVIPAHRGNLLDRNGEPLAISTPIKTLWGKPKSLAEQPAAMREVAALLNLDAEKLNARITDYAERDREFVYIARHIEPARVERVLALKIDGLQADREFRRYYPSGPAAAHLIGFTDIDDRGREGLEMAYDDWLSGESGRRRLLQDRYGREIDELELIKPALPGKDLALSIDRQLQYIASRALADVISRHRAESASLVVMKVQTGEIMAMANYPTYNPNDTSDRSGGRQRNRAVTDVFEPGSTMKPFTIAAALASGRFQPDSIVHTSPGSYRIGKYRISDTKDHGWLDLGGIVTKSSNVGVSKVARDLDPEQMWEVFDAFGFGRPPGSEFPGEVAGYFNHPTLWHHIEQASVSYGYGIAVSALQLVRAYAAIANDGVMPPVSFVALDEVPEGRRVIDEDVAADVSRMLESVVLEGTGTRARIPGYTVAGKTGTSHRSQSGSYAEDRYISLFAGFAPASDPEYAAVVVVHDPKAGGHFGSQVAAPVFAEVMAHALRIGGIEPDDIDGERAHVIGVRKPAGADDNRAGAIGTDAPAGADDNRAGTIGIDVPTGADQQRADMVRDDSGADRS